MSTPIAHGYGMPPQGWAPGYCWCGRPGYDGFGGRDEGCLELALLLGRMPKSHREAYELGRAHGMFWDGLESAEAWTARMAAVAGVGARDVP